MIQQNTAVLTRTFADQLRCQAAESESGKIDYLIIAHDDPRMLQRLCEAMGDKTVAVVTIPQTCWAMDGEAVEELLHCAVTDVRVSRILVVGHSNGGTPAEQVRILPHTATQRDEMSIQERNLSLAECLRQYEASLNCCEEHFIGQLSHVSQYAFTKEKIETGELALDGLFYRCEAGVFCVYNRDRQQFQALVA
jgi:carbonic anhydrase